MSTLVLAACLGAFGAFPLSNAYSERRQAVIDASAHEAARAAFEAERWIEGRLRVLSAIASAPPFATGDVAAARAYLAPMDASKLGFDGLIFYVDSAGLMQAVSTAAAVPPPQLPLDISDRAYLQPPRESGEPYVGAAFMGVLNPRPLLPLVVPVRGPDGTVTGLIGGTLLLEPRSQDLAFTPDTRSVVVDRAGQIILRGGQAVTPVNVSQPALLAQMRSERHGSRTDATGLSGEPQQLIGFAEVPRTGWMIAVTDAMSTEMAPVARQTARSLSTLVLALVSMLAVARGTAYALDRAAAAERQVLAAEHEARRVAEDTLKVREQEIGAIAHDLRSLLTVIYGMTGSLQRRRGDAESVPVSLVLDRAHEIETAVKRMDAMIEDLLDAARLEAGKAVMLNCQPGDLTAILREAVEDQQRRTLSHRLILRAPTSIHGEWDAPRLRRVFANLLSNAVKFSPEGGEIGVAATVDSSDGEPLAVVVVRDSGIGIPPEDLPRLFDRFSRGSNATGIDGTGLGLSSAQHLVQLHGGTISVESREREGSTFFVRLPLSRGGLEERHVGAAPK